MLKGNRRLAAVIAGLIAVTLTAALTPYLGIPAEIAMAALGIEGALAGGGAMFEEPVT